MKNVSSVCAITTTHLVVLKSLSAIWMAARKCPLFTAMLMSFPGLYAQPASSDPQPLSLPHDWITAVMGLIQRTKRVTDRLDLAVGNGDYLPNV